MTQQVYWICSNFIEFAATLFNLQQLYLIYSNFILFAATCFKLQQPYFIWSNFSICSMSLLGHVTNRIPHWITSASILICATKQIKFILTGTCDSCLFAPAPRELDSCSNHRKGRLADSTCGKYRWFSHYVIAAMLVDESKRFLISSFCSSTSTCTLQYCCLSP